MDPAADNSVECISPARGVDITKRPPGGGGSAFAKVTHRKSMDEDPIAVKGENHSTYSSPVQGPGD